MGTKHVLLVEDHAELAETVGDYLESSGFIVDYAADGPMALHLAVRGAFDAIVLDVVIPGIDGLDVCRRLREQSKLTTPIIMLTARDRLDDKLTGFDAGADDYLVKPFDLAELVARLQAIIRRAEGLSSRYEAGELVMDLESMTVTRRGRPITLSKTVFEILRVLMREAPRVVSRQELERALWGEEPPDSDPLRSHLYNLRQAVDKPFDTALVETLPGRGYRINVSRPAV